MKLETHLELLGKLKELAEADDGQEWTPAEEEVFSNILLTEMDFFGIRYDENGTPNKEDLIRDSEDYGSYSFYLLMDTCLFFAEKKTAALLALPETRAAIMENLTEEQIKQRAIDTKSALEAKKNGEAPSLYEFMDFLGFRFAMECFKTLPAATRRKLKSNHAEGFQPLEVVPNSKALQRLNNIIAGSGRDLSNYKAYKEVENTTNEVTITRSDGTAETYLENVTIYTNTDTGESCIIRTNSPKEEEGKRGPKTSKGKARLIGLFWQQFAKQHFPSSVKLFYTDLLELGICTNRHHAVETLTSFASWFCDTSPRSSYYLPAKGKRKAREIAGDTLVSGWREISGGVAIKLNSGAAIFDLYASFYSVFPTFGYRLSDNGYLILRYIFYIARQKTAFIDKNKRELSFAISLDALRGAAGIPTPEEVKEKYARKYPEKIKKPILAALEEIQEQLKKERNLKTDCIELKRSGKEESNIDRWLESLLQVTLRGDIIDAFEENNMIRKPRLADTEETKAEG